MPNIMAMRWQKLYRSTPAELALEDAVAAIGVPYRNQYPGYQAGFRFFPDFLLPTLGLIIEVDDPSHDRTAKKLEDAERTEQLEARGFQVVRCTNDEALADPHGTVRGLLASVGMWPVPEPAKRKRIADCLPRAAKCPKKIKREAKSADRQARRAAPKRPTRSQPPPEAYGGHGIGALLSAPGRLVPPGRN